MKHTLRFVLVGGDVRQVCLGERLAADGASVQTIGLERQTTDLPTSRDLRETLAQADVVLLPIPVVGARGRLNAPLANAPYKLTEVLDAIPAGTLVYGGSVPKMVHDMAARRGLRVTDYLEREELALRNAIPTAEGAIQIAMEELSVTIHGLSVLILGAGRIGTALAPRLRGLGAQVTISARSCADFARIENAGFAYLDTRRLQGKLHSFSLLVNTIPCPVLTRAVLTDCEPEALLIDLASGAGGVAADAGDCVRVIHALSLPGKVAPRSAAEAIYITVCHMLDEEGLL